MPPPAVAFTVHLSTNQTLSPNIALSEKNVPNIPATHCNAFRGYYWLGASAVASQASETSVCFKIVMPWALRPPTFLETQNNASPHPASFTDPYVISLDFIHTTPTRSEFRGNTSFSILDLEKQRTVHCEAHCNAFLLGDPTINRAQIPHVYTAFVTWDGFSGDYVRPDEHATEVVASLILQTRTLPEFKDTDAVQWVFDLLSAFASHHTLFKNLRTYTRLPFFPPNFTDLPVLWAHADSPMPPEIPLYLIANAAIVHDFTVTEVLVHLPRLENIRTPRLLRFVRDILMGFTMCLTEGLYQADTTYGFPSDDQAFVSGMHHDHTVFARDDCEGRLQQGLLVLQTLCATAAVDAGTLFHHIRSRALPCLARLSDPVLTALIQICKTIAWLFNTNRLCFHMCVGEAAFKAFNGPSANGTPPTPAQRDAHLEVHSASPPPALLFFHISA